MPGPIRAFISYPRQERKYARTLDNELFPHRRAGRLATWWDNKLAAGTKWQDEIDFALAQAHLVLLLVTREYICSPNCRAELEEAQQRNAAIIPIILRACSWKEVPEISTRQLLPQNGDPIYPRRDPNAAWVEVSDGIWNRAQSLGPAGNRQPGTAPLWLPFLCDRDDELESFSQALQSHTHPKPFICILAGGARDAHREFIQRLERDTIPGILRLRADSGVFEPEADLSWDGLNPDLKPVEIFAPFLAAHDEIPASIARHSGLSVLRFAVSAAEWRPGWERLLEKFEEFWKGWPPLMGGRHLVIFLSIKFGQDAERNSAIGEALSRYAGSSNPKLIRLAPIRRSQVDEWLQKPLVQRHCDPSLIRPHLDLLFNGDAVLPLETLAGPLAYLSQLYPRVTHA
jgi:hypothetical protein